MRRYHLLRASVAGLLLAGAGCRLCGERGLLARHRDGDPPSAQPVSNLTVPGAAGVDCNCGPLTTGASLVGPAPAFGPPPAGGLPYAPAAPSPAGPLNELPPPGGLETIPSPGVPIRGAAVTIPPPGVGVPVSVPR